MLFSKSKIQKKKTKQNENPQIINSNPRSKNTSNKSNIKTAQTKSEPKDINQLLAKRFSYIRFR